MSRAGQLWCRRQKSKPCCKQQLPHDEFSHAPAATLLQCWHLGRRQLRSPALLAGGTGLPGPELVVVSSSPAVLPASPVLLDVVSSSEPRGDWYQPSSSSALLRSEVVDAASSSRAAAAAGAGAGRGGGRGRASRQLPVTACVVRGKRDTPRMCSLDDK
jgi:hypothetical protein